MSRPESTPDWQGAKASASSWPSPMDTDVMTDSTQATATLVPTADLAEAMLHVSPDWLNTAIARYQTPLLKYAERLLGDAERAQDAVQETFLKLCQQAPSNVQHRLAEWLFTVCRNLVLDWKRKEQRLLRQQTDAGTEPAANPQATDPTLPVELREQVLRVRQLMETLPTPQREALRLRFDSGFSYRQIGEITGQTANHVGVLLHQAIKTLRQQVQQQ